MPVDCVLLASEISSQRQARNYRRFFRHVCLLQREWVWEISESRYV